MNKKLMTLLAPLAALGFGISTAHATFISSNFVDNGDYTTDIVSGLDWLDMSYTDFLSYSNVQSLISSGGSLEGWTVATVEQVETLFNHASSNSPLPIESIDWCWYCSPGNEETGIIAYGLDYYPEAKGLINLLGPTTIDTSDESQITKINGFTADTAYGGYKRIATTYIEDSISGTPEDGRFYTPILSAIQTTSYSDFGTFLVRDSSSVSVPEPSSLLLMGIGLAGLGFVRRRKRS